MKSAYFHLFKGYLYFLSCELLKSFAIFNWTVSCFDIRCSLWYLIILIKQQAHVQCKKKKEKKKKVKIKKPKI